MLQGLVVTSALFVLLLGAFLFPAPPGLATDLQYVCEEDSAHTETHLSLCHIYVHT